MRSFGRWGIKAERSQGRVRPGVAEGSDAPDDPKGTPESTSMALWPSTSLSYKFANPRTRRPSIFNHFLKPLGHVPRLSGTHVQHIVTVFYKRGARFPRVSTWARADFLSCSYARKNDHHRTTASTSSSMISAAPHIAFSEWLDFGFPEIHKAPACPTILAPNNKVHLVLGPRPRHVTDTTLRTLSPATACKSGLRVENLHRV